jgi:hypothetical protein
MVTVVLDARLSPLALPDRPWEVVGMAMPGPNLAAPMLFSTLVRLSRRPARPTRTSLG